MKLKSLIVDDEELARENLKMLLEEYCPDIEVLGTAGSVKEAKAKINELSPQVVFLDIRMPSGAEGFELLESLPEKKFQVVFVTAFKDYAIKAFNANAIHYVMKPVDIEDLQQAVEKLKSYSTQFQVDPDNFSAYIKALENLTQNLSSDAPIKRITINHSKGFKIVDDDDIVHLEANGNCTSIHFNDGGRYLDTKTMKIYENILDDVKFFRIHKSHIINMNYLKEYLNEDGYFVIMKDGAQLPIARNRLSTFMERIKSL